MGEGWGPQRPAADSWARRRNSYAEILGEGGVILVAQEDGRIVGHAVAEQEEGGSPTWEWPPSVLAIVDVSVLPEARGRGIGTLLLEELQAEAERRGVAALALMVMAPNEGARRFYERHGFTPSLLEYRRPLGGRGPSG